MMTAHNQLTLHAIQQQLHNIHSRNIKTYKNAFTELNNKIDEFNKENERVDADANKLIMYFPMEIVELIKSFVNSEVDVLFEWTRIYRDKSLSIINNIIYKQFITDFNDFVDNNDIDYYNNDSILFSWYDDYTREQLRNRKIVQVDITYIHYNNKCNSNDVRDNTATHLDNGFLLMYSHFCVNCGNYTGIFHWNEERDRDFYDFLNITPDNPYSRNVFCKCAN